MSVLLLSGGLDSSVCLAEARGAGNNPTALFVDYGQPHLCPEFAAATRLAWRYQTPLRYAKVTFPAMRFDASDGTMLVPGRNLVLIALAATIGEPVIMGCNADDHDVYEDCRAEYFNALAPTVAVVTPLLDLTKQQIGALAREWGLADETWSCYYPEAGEPCGRCDACAGRARALAC